ncbi:MAG: hypothetical protein E7340_00065 [Clostridiales bacterium]|nr:hypothetical protein [Clostridiales bacterium]
MIKKIKSVRTNRKKHRVDNFLKAISMPVNLIVKKDGVFDGYGLKKTVYKAPTDIQVIRLFKVGEKFFSLCKNGSLYESRTSRVDLVGEIYNMDASILEINVNGQSDILVARNENVYTLNGYGDFKNFPRSNAILFHNGRYFIANYNKVYITGLYDILNSNSNFNIVAQLALNNSGKILGFCPRGDEIIAVCENAIYKITTSDDVAYYKAEELNIDKIVAIDRTFAFDNGSCVFLNDQKLAKLTGDKLVEKNTILDVITYKFFGIGEYIDGRYYLPIMINSKDRYLFVYDFANGAQTLVSLKENGFAWGNMVVQDGAIYTLANNTLCQNERNLTLSAIDFDDCDYKTLSGVSCEIDGDATLKISGDFGVKTYSLYTGRNSLVINLSSRAFVVELTSSNPLKIKDFALEYRLKGE